MNIGICHLCYRIIIPKASSVEFIIYFNTETSEVSVQHHDSERKRID